LGELHEESVPVLHLVTGMCVWAGGAREGRGGGGGAWARAVGARERGARACGCAGTSCCARRACRRV
jgi:hypothetical protein